MKPKDQKYFLLNYVFLAGLILLVLNDHVWKVEYHNAVTGKISDFAGVLIAPMLLCYFFPGRRLEVLIFIALGFVFWKSPYSEPLINWYNSFAPIGITRVVDYSDLIALTVLPVSYLVMSRLHELPFLKIRSTLLKPIYLVLPTLFIFSATSPPLRPYYQETYGTLKIRENFDMNKSDSEILKTLSQSGLNILIDSFEPLQRNIYGDNWRDSITEESLSRFYPSSYNPFFIIDTLVIARDTIVDLQIALQYLGKDETKIWINGMNLVPSITSDDVTESMQRKYFRRIRKELKRRLR